MNQNDQKTIFFGNISKEKMEQQNFANIIRTESLLMTSDSVKAKISFLNVLIAKLSSKLKNRKNQKVAQILRFQTQLKEALERKEQNLGAISRFNRLIRENKEKKTRIEAELMSDFARKREKLKQELKELNEEVSELTKFEEQKVE